MKAIGSQLLAEQTDPFTTINIGVTSLVFRPAEHPGFGPGKGYEPQRSEIVLTLDFGKLIIEGRIDPETRERLQVTPQWLRRGIQHAVGPIRIVKPVSKCSIRTRQRPVLWLPWVRPPADTADRLMRFYAEGNRLTPSHEGSDRAENFRSDDFEIAFAHEADGHAVVQFGI